MHRRSERRYEIALDVRWKRVHGKRVLESGNGTTIDLSSRGLLFETGGKLLVGAKIELSIAWPVLLRNVVPLQLVVNGEVVRAAKGRVAVRMLHHEFRTVSITLARRVAEVSAATWLSVPR